MTQTMQGRTDGGSESRDEIEICIPIQIVSEKQSRILIAIDEYGHVGPYGELDITDVMKHVESSKNYVWRVWGQHGRIAHYTNAVDTPQIEVVTDSTGQTGMDMLALVRQHGKVNPNGTIDHESVYDHMDDDAPYSRKQVVDRVIGQHCRVLVPLREHDSNQLPDDVSRNARESRVGVTDTPTTVDDHDSDSDDPIIIFDDDGMPDPDDLSEEAYAAFDLGWKSRGKWERKRESMQH